MEAKKWMMILGYALIGVSALTNVLFIIQADRLAVGVPGGPFSMFPTRESFIVWNLWSIVAAVGTGVTWYLERRFLFFLFLTVLIILQFFPYFSAGK